ncbi:MAG: RDD family protein [Propionibacteriales bacterium]|nr:RDD family protein [Propionibacteriales bacterium]
MTAAGPNDPHTPDPHDVPGSGAPPGAVPGDLGPRLGARVIDGVILLVVGVLLGMALDFGVVWLVIQAFLVFAYFVVLDTSWGTTPGKRLFGLRVTGGADGGPPTLGGSAIREAFTLLGAVPYAGALLALAAWITIAVTVNSSPTKQGAHDRLAGGTQVVRA